MWLQLLSTSDATSSIDPALLAEISIDKTLGVLFLGASPLHALQNKLTRLRQAMSSQQCKITASCFLRAIAQLHP